jgi:mono/diheme cytochrome c family protein
MNAHVRLAGLLTLLALALGCAACGGSGGKSAATTAPATTTAKQGTANLAEGKTIFTTSCAGCHTLAAAGAVGNVGPNLDDAKLPVAELVDITTNGRTGAGTMPAFVGSLTPDQIQDVAAYVSSVAGK